MKYILIIAAALTLAACSTTGPDGQPWGHVAHPATANEYRCNAEGCKNVKVPYDHAIHDGEVGECDDEKRSAGNC